MHFILHYETEKGRVGAENMALPSATKIKPCLYIFYMFSF